MNAPVRTAAVLGVVVIGEDQATKAAATRAGVVLRNPGYALGVVAGSPVLLTLGMVLVLALFLGTLARWAVRGGASPLGPAFIAAGIAGNTIDRICYGAARDFIRTPWAIVNVADLAVLAGLAMFVIALAQRAIRRPEVDGVEPA